VIAPCWVGAAQDLVVDGYNGVVLDSNAPAALAAGMEIFLDDPGRAAEMGSRGPEVVSAGGWDLDGAIERTAVVLEALS
jgi:glycosyltransferase involved in cell wall biosynthesis